MSNVCTYGKRMYEAHSKQHGTLSKQYVAVAHSVASRSRRQLSGNNKVHLFVMTDNELDVMI